MGMNKLMIVGVFVVVLVLAMVYFYQRVSFRGMRVKSAEEEAIDVVEQELEEALANVTEEEVENALLSQ
jgi:uncharacterized protein YpmB